jgi:hypothetical protein
LTYTDTSAALAFYEDAGQTLEDIMLGRSVRIRAWKPVTTLTRATPGTSSAVSIYCPSNQYLFTETKYLSPFGDVLKTTVKVQDYNEVNGGRWSNEYEVSSATAHAIILGVTITPNF